MERVMNGIEKEVKESSSSGAGREVRNSDERLSKLLESLDAVVYVTDMATNEVLFLNRRGRELFGDVTGKICWQELQTTQEGPCEFCTNRNLVDEQGNPTGVYRWEFKNTVTNRWYDCRDLALVWTDGRLARLEIATDITERKKWEEKLRVSEEKFKRLFESYPYSTVYLDTKGNIVDCNREFLNLHGVSGGYDSVIGRSLADFIPEEMRASFKDFNELLSKGKGDVEPIEAHLLREDGTRFVGEAWIKPIIDDDGNPIAIISSVKNISKRKKIEEERARAGKLESLGILAGGIAHDFNNILTIILGSIEVAKMHALPGSESYRILSEASDAASRATSLTKQLLTFSKGGKPIKKAIDIKDAVKDSVDFALRGANVKCFYTFPREALAVEVDEGQIGQVISNIVINAKQSMPEGGVIRIRLDSEEVTNKMPIALAPGKYAVVSIEDSGHGMTREHLVRIFDPYFSTKKEGSGLGLAISYSIVKNHDGFIMVDSEPGRGTKFTIYLPITPKAIPVKESPQLSMELKGAGKVLVMDDEQNVRKVISRMVGKFGFRTDMAEEGSEAVKLFEKAHLAGEPYDFVIMDLTIPGGMGGKEAIKEVLKIDPQAKVIVASGYSNDPVLADYRDYGFQGVIAKPFTMEAMERVLREIVG